MKRTKELQNAVDSFAKKSFGRGLSKSQKEKVCVFCNSDKCRIEDFRDGLSWKEYNISGMCQKCQDKFFGVDE